MIQIILPVIGELPGGFLFLSAAIFHGGGLPGRLIVATIGGVILLFFCCV